MVRDLELRAANLAQFGVLALLGGLVLLWGARQGPDGFGQEPPFSPEQGSDSSQGRSFGRTWVWPVAVLVF
jgi:hypothetical protein